MSNRVELRPLTSEEEQAIKRLARPQTAPMRQVQRAQIIAAMTEDPDLSAVVAGLSNAVNARTSTRGLPRARRRASVGLHDLDVARRGRAPCKNFYIVEAAGELLPRT